LAEIDATGKELKRLLDDFKEEFEHDRQLRIRREESMVKQLTDHEHEVAERFQSQIVSELLNTLYCCISMGTVVDYISTGSKLVLLR
jgi:hypothetical protein